MTGAQSASQKEAILGQLRAGYLPSAAETKLIQRDKIQESVQFQTALISPIRRLPDDVVEGIFLACLPAHRNPAMSTVEAPLLFISLLTFLFTWRALALSTRKLWAALHIQTDFVLHREERVHAVTQWLERSAPHPLSLSVFGTQVDPVETSTPSSKYTAQSMYSTILLDAVLKSAPRWREVALAELSPSYFHKLQGLSTPVLQTVDIKDGRNVTEWLDLFGQSTVRTLSVQLKIPEEHIPLLLPRLSHIIHLTMLSHPWSGPEIRSVACLAIIQNLPQLVSLRATFRELDPTGFRITHLPQLESLDLASLDSELPLLDNLLAHLFMPRLSHLAIQGPEVAQLNTPFFAALRERSPVIDELEIFSSNFTQDALLHSLRNLPSLTKILLFDGSVRHESTTHPLVDAEYLLTLLAARDGTSLCSRLRALEIRYSQTFLDETLANFLQARIDVGAAFRLKIHFADGDTIIPDVERFRSTDMHIYYPFFNEMALKLC
ncbi:hypothetical protein C8R43DRAFT_1136645 [Mycena crocata]|nr:hypothetical protein C8R43DRAFT_1136645 [Mycena crocata]